MKVQPVRNFIKVRELPAEEEFQQTQSGIFLPSSTPKTAKSHVFAEVVAVGPGYNSEFGAEVNSGFKPGDRVMFKKHPNLDVLREGGVEYLMVPGSEVTGLLVDKYTHEE